MAQDDYLQVARLRTSARAAIEAALTALPVTDQRALLAELLVERENSNAQVLAQATPGARKAAAPTEDRKFSSIALEVLQRTPSGARLGELAPRIYPGVALPKAKKNARSILRWLAQSGKITKTEDGVYLAITTQTNGRTSPSRQRKQVGRRVTGSVPDLVLKSIETRGEPSTSGQVLADVRKAMPKVKAVLVYGAINRKSKSGEIHQTSRGGKMYYSLPNGGQQ